LLALRYYLPGSYYRIPEDIPLPELLAENETLNGALKQLEEVLLDSVTLQGYSSLGNRQNNFAFSKLYFFLLWARAKAKNETSEPATFVEMDKKLREEMIIIFAALIWADDYVDNTEQQVIDKYIEQTELQESKQNELTLRILEPVKIEDIQCSSTSGIISRYLVEQLILLSLIDNQGVWQERELIEKISVFNRSKSDIESKLLGFNNEQLIQKESVLNMHQYDKSTLESKIRSTEKELTDTIEFIPKSIKSVESVLNQISAVQYTITLE